MVAISHLRKEQIIDSGRRWTAVLDRPRLASVAAGSDRPLLRSERPVAALSRPGWLRGGLPARDWREDDRARHAAQRTGNDFDPGVHDDEARRG